MGVLQYIAKIIEGIVACNDDELSGLTPPQNPSAAKCGVCMASDDIYVTHRVHVMGTALLLYRPGVQPCERLGPLRVMGGPIYGSLKATRMSQQYGIEGLKWQPKSQPAKRCELSKS